MSISVIAAATPTIEKIRILRKAWLCLSWPQALWLCKWKSATLTWYESARGQWICKRYQKTRIIRMDNGHLVNHQLVDNAWWTSSPNQYILIISDGNCQCAKSLRQGGEGCLPLDEEGFPESRRLNFLKATQTSKHHSRFEQAQNKTH